MAQLHDRVIIAIVLATRCHILQNGVHGRKYRKLLACLEKLRIIAKNFEEMPEL